MHLYWTCYQILTENQDSQADEIAQEAVELICTRAASCHPEVVRLQFLDVALN